MKLCLIVSCAIAAGAVVTSRVEAAPVIAPRPAPRPVSAPKPVIADPKAVRLVETFKHDRPMIACRFDGSGRYLFTGAQDNKLLRWNLADGNKTELAGHRTWVRRLALHPGGELMVSGEYSGRLLWWNPADADPRPLREIDAHHGYVRAVAISPDRQWIATGGNDAVVKVWSAADGNLVAELTGHDGHFPDPKGKAEDVYKNHIYNVAFSPGGQYLVSGDLVGLVKQWEVGAWKEVRELDARVLHKFDPTFRAHCGGIRGMDFSPDGRQLVVCGIGEVTNAFAGVGVPTAVLFDCETGKRLAVMKPAKNFRGACWSIRFDPAGRFIVGAGGGSSGSLWFWKPGEEKSFFDFKLPNVAYDCAFHPGGLKLAVALYDKTARVYDLAPKTEVAGKSSLAAKTSKK